MSAEPAVAPRVVAVTGATGYLGRPLLRRLLERGAIVRALTRDARAAAPALEGVHYVVEGSLSDSEAVERLLVPGCDVIHLAHLWDASHEANLGATRVLLAACARRQSRRLIYASSVAVFGRVPGDRLDESSPCAPVIPYAKTKLAIERLLREEADPRLQYAVVRPATVFGEPAPPLAELAERLARGNRAANYLRSVLFDGRRMNLVHVANVIGAILFLAAAEPFPRGATFIVSDDEDPANNFRDVEVCLMRALGVPDYRLPRLPAPQWFLGLLLRLRGHNNVNPRRVFDSSRVARLGYAKPVRFAEGLREAAVLLAARSKV